jgi:type I pantothenate kinase
VKTRGSLARRVAVECGADPTAGLAQLAQLVRWQLGRSAPWGAQAACSSPSAGARAAWPPATARLRPEHRATARHHDAPPLALIGIGGSVAAGKTTLAHALCHALASATGRRVAVVGTDGFLLSDRELERRGLLAQKGFPATYDDARLRDFVDALRDGRELRVPHYCHRSRAVTHHETLARPDLLILEGVIALRTLPLALHAAARCGIYLQAPLAAIEGWYIERYRRVRRPSDRGDTGGERQLDQALDDDARAVWQRTNLPNLVEHIRPGRRSADLVVHKRLDHSLEKIWLRTLAWEA